MSSGYHIQWNKKHSSKQFILTTYTLEKGFVAAATFEGLWAASFQREREKERERERERDRDRDRDRVHKNVVYFSLCESSLHF